MASRSDADDFCGVVFGEDAGAFSDGVFNDLFEVAGRFEEGREGTEDILAGAWLEFASLVVVLWSGSVLTDTSNAPWTDGRDLVGLAPRVLTPLLDLSASVLLMAPKPGLSLLERRFVGDGLDLDGVK